MDIKKNGLESLTFHHVGLLVEDIKDSIEQYSELFGRDKVSSIINIESQKVKVCFVKIGACSFIELVMPTNEDSVVYKLIKKRVTYYHVAYKVKHLSLAVRKLEQLNYKALEFFDSEAFEDKRCIFLYTPEAHLIELIED